MFQYYTFTSNRCVHIHVCIHVCVCVCMCVYVCVCVRVLMQIYRSINYCYFHNLFFLRIRYTLLQSTLCGSYAHL